MTIAIAICKWCSRKHGEYPDPSLEYLLRNLHGQETRCLVYATEDASPLSLPQLASGIPGIQSVEPPKYLPPAALSTNFNPLNVTMPAQTQSSSKAWVPLDPILWAESLKEREIHVQRQRQRSTAPELEERNASIMQADRLTEYNFTGSMHEHGHQRITHNPQLLASLHQEPRTIAGRKRPRPLEWAEDAKRAAPPVAAGSGKYLHEYRSSVQSYERPAGEHGMMEHRPSRFVDMDEGKSIAMSPMSLQEHLNEERKQFIAIKQQDGIKIRSNKERKEYVKGLEHQRHQLGKAVLKERAERRRRLGLPDLLNRAPRIQPSERQKVIEKRQYDELLKWIVAEGEAEKRGKEAALARQLSALSIYPDIREATGREGFECRQEQWHCAAMKRLKLPEEYARKEAAVRKFDRLNYFKLPRTQRYEEIVRREMWERENNLEEPQHEEGKLVIQRKLLFPKWKWEWSKAICESSVLKDRVVLASDFSDHEQARINSAL